MKRNFLSVFFVVTMALALIAIFTAPAVGQVPQVPKAPEGEPPQQSWDQPQLTEDDVQKIVQAELKAAEDARKKAEEEKKKKAEEEARKAQKQAAAKEGPGVMTWIAVAIGVLAAMIFIFNIMGRRRREEEVPRVVPEEERAPAPGQAQAPAAGGEPGEPQAPPAGREAPAQPGQPPAQPAQRPPQEGGQQGGPGGAGPQAAAMLVFALFMSGLMAAPVAKVTSVSPKYALTGRTLEVTYHGQFEDVTGVEFITRGVSGSLIGAAGAREMKVEVVVDVKAATMLDYPIRVTFADGSKRVINHPALLVINREQERNAAVAGRLVAAQRARTADPVTSHELQANFQWAYGKEEGNKRYLEYIKNPTHDAITKLLDKMAEKIVEMAVKTVKEQMSQEIDGKLNAATAKLDEAVAEIQAAKEEFGKTAETIHAEGETYTDQKVGELAEAHAQTRAVLVEVGEAVEKGFNEKVKKGGFLGFGGRQKPLAPEQAKAVRAALAKLKP